MESPAGVILFSRSLNIATDFVEISLNLRHLIGSNDVAKLLPAAMVNNLTIMIGVGVYHDHD